MKKLYEAIDTARDLMSQLEYLELPDTAEKDLFEGWGLSTTERLEHCQKKAHGIVWELEMIRELIENEEEA